MRQMLARLLAGTVVALLAGVVQAAVILPPPSTSSYAFSGACIDCSASHGPGMATGTLVLDSYTPGDPLSVASFVSFSYYSERLGDLFAAAGDVVAFTGSLPAVPGPAYLNLEWRHTVGGVTTPYYFKTFADGSWDLAVGAPTSGYDQGGAGSATWSPILVPEPVSLGLLGLGLAGLGLARRRRRT